MKFLFLCIFLYAVCASEAVIYNAADCKCWEDFKPERLEPTGSYYCRGEKHHRIFGCGEERPPICLCEVGGKTISLDLGETSCLSVDLQNGRWCKNKEEFQQYFKKHPEHAIYD